MALFLLACWLLVPSLSAQTGNTLLVPGVVVDEVGAAVVGARVIVTDTGCSVVATTTSDAEGAFSLHVLVPGTEKLGYPLQGASIRVSYRLGFGQ